MVYCDDKILAWIGLQDIETCNCPCHTRHDVVQRRRCPDSAAESLDSREETPRNCRCKGFFSSASFRAADVRGAAVATDARQLTYDLNKPRIVNSGPGSRVSAMMPAIASWRNRLRFARWAMKSTSHARDTAFSASL